VKQLFGSFIGLFQDVNELSFEKILGKQCRLEL